MKVAIVGAACRLPGGVHSLETLWELLASGRDAVSTIPEDRFDVASFQHPNRAAAGRSCTFAAGIVEHVEDFDFSFFGISKKEAEYLDPQQRLLLELAWEALEDAQIRASDLAGTPTAVFIGSSSLDGSMMRADDPCVIGPYSMVGNTLSLLANRISYLLDIRGPSMTIDTACSSSLVALHQACQTLASGEAGLAIAGGVHMLLSPLPFVGFSKAHMLSADGRCKVFSKEANGYVRAEGGGVLLLKPLDAALADGDHIHAVINRSGINTDGKTIGIAFPNQEAQMDLLRTLYADGGVDVRNLCYMEAHGTGTNAGDPVEARAIGQVFSELRPGEDPLLVGSIKTNLGHLEPASGMAGLLKAVLVLQKRAVPPNLHLDVLNPDIDFAGLRLQPVTTLTPVPDTPGPLLAGVSSFGFGGANAHVILEQAPPGRPVAPGRAAPEHTPPLLLSAHGLASLRRLAATYADRLDAAGEADYAAVAGRTVLRRDHLSHRLVVPGETPQAVVRRLRAFAADGGDKADGQGLILGEALGGAVRTAFVFSGNGGPWPGMGRALLEADPAAAAALARLDAVLTGLLGWSVRDRLLGPPEAQDLTRIEIVQPLLFAVQVCLFEALAAKGLAPDLVFGHSIGEIAAAYACGALDLETACRVIVVRSRLQGTTEGQGGMAVVQLTADEASALPEVAAGDLSVAAVNSPRYVTLSGPDALLDGLRPRLRKQRVVFRKLDLRYPFHSPLMEPIRDRLLAEFRDLHPAAGRLPFYSTVTGAVCPGTDLTAAYWWRNIRQPVLFGQAASTALADGARVFVELGPDAQLAPFLKACREEHAGTSAYLPSLRRDVQNPDLARELCWRVHVLGGTVDLSRPFPTLPPYVPLPGYPWDREHCLVEPTSECLGLFRAKPPAHPLLGRPVREQLSVWENTLDLELLPFLADHVLDGEPVLPGAAALEIALAAGLAAYGGQGVELENIEFRQPLPLGRGKARLVRFHLGEGGDFRIESREHMQAQAMTTHFLGRVVPHRDPAKDHVAPRRAPDPETFGEACDVPDLYRKGRDAGLAFGPAFRPMAQVWRRDDSAMVRLELLPGADFPGAILHPCLLDGAFQTLLALVEWEQKLLPPVVYLPLRVGRLRLLRPGQPKLAVAELTRQNKRSLAADFTLFDADGRELASLTDCRFSRFQTRESLQQQQKAHALTAIPARHPLDPAPVHLPAPTVLSAGLDRTLAALAADPVRLARHRDCLPFLTAAMVSRLSAALGALAPGRTVWDLDQFFSAGRLSPEQAPYVRYVLNLLVDMDLAERVGERFRLLPCDLPPLSELWAQALRDDPSWAEELNLLSRWDAALDAALRGEHEDAFWRAPLPRQDGWEALAAVVLGLRAALPDGLPLRVVEINAGAGGLTQALLARLTRGAFEYLATDADPGQAEQLGARFGDLPGVSCAVYDAQGSGAVTPEALSPGGCDLVLAASLPRRCDDLPLALERLSGLLRPGGLLVLLDDTPHPARHLLHGLSPDWWRDEGPDQPATRLLTLEEWTVALATAGFAAVAPLGGPPQDGDLLLLAARKAPEEPVALMAEPTLAGRRFVLLTDAEPAPEAAALDAALTARLAADGLAPIRVTPGPGWCELGPDRYRLDPEAPEHWERLFAVLGAASPDAPLECIHLLGHDARQELDPDTLDALQNRQVTSAAMLVRGWNAAKRPAGLCLVSAGGVPLTGHPCRVVPSQGGLAGLARVAVNEAPGLFVRLVDVQGGPDAPVAAAVREILFAPGSLLPGGGLDDRDVVLTPGGRYLLRLAPLELIDRDRPALDGPAAPVTLDMVQQGRLSGASWRRCPDKIPGPGEVCLDNRAAGVNYRDVMFTLGRIPEEALEGGASGPSLGLECAGVITAVGPGVTDLAPGDRVCCLAGGCYDAQVVARAETVFRLPEGMSFADAATLPVAHFTAYYALAHLIRLEPGERVLIHGAAGGVGQAAIQVARALGAEIIATAGSPAKRLLLARQGLTRVFDSRSPDCADRIRDALGGEGVDVVLNSIAGEVLYKSMELLNPLGRFLELGKVDFYANSPLRMRLLRQNISFFGIDVDQVVREKPALCRRLFLDMLELFAAGRLVPLPHASQPRAAVTELFRTMQHAGHIGKLVLVPDAVPAAHRQAAGPTLGPLSAEASYLVSGGLGGLGLATAKRLVSLGARHLVLIGRSGAAKASAKAAVDSLTAAGASVTVLAADLSDAAAVDGVLAPALDALPPLGGIVHCAGILRDATIVNLTPEAIRAVLRAKALSAYTLHRLSLGRPVDFFVLFSSATTVLGNPGQANYVAANTGLEALAAYRRSLGLPAVTFGWGPVTDVGMLADRPEVLDSLQRVTGASGLTSSTALDFVEAYARGMWCNLHVFRLHLATLGRLPYVASPAYDYLKHDGGGEQTTADRDAIRRTLRTLPTKEAVAHLATMLTQHFARIMRLPASRIRHDKPLGELGMDSLMYVELGLAIEETFGVDISSLTLDKEASILTLAGALYRLLADDAQPSAAQSVAETLRRQHGIHLSEDSVNRLLADDGATPQPSAKPEE